MRFTSRSAERSVVSTADDVLQLGDATLPAKAELFLGAKTRLGRRKAEKAGRKGDGFEHMPNEQQKSLGTLLRAQEALLDTQQSLLDDMPDGRPRLNVWPNIEHDNRSASDVRNLYPVQQALGRPGIPPRRTSSNAVQNYYDPTKQPSYVSQQTSASAVRDMGLRKGSPMIHETSSDPTLTRRPLKSALKKPGSFRSPEPKQPQSPETMLTVRTNSHEKKPRKLDLSQFFPQPRSHSRNHLPLKSSARSPSVAPEPSDYSPDETVHVQLRRPSANAPYETHKTLKSPPPAPLEPRSVPRQKVLEPDMFSQAKTNVRRPPKGIQNWFDGFDISSDEDEAEAEPEKPKPRPQAEPQELPADEAMPSTVSPWHLKPDNEQPRPDRKASKDPVEDNLLAIRHAKERMQERMRMVDHRNDSVDSVTLASFVSSEAPVRRRGGGSRLAMLELASESVLALSDSSGDERAEVSTLGAQSVIPDTASSRVDYPVGPPTKLKPKRSVPQANFLRESNSTVQTTQTSGSIPIRLTDSIPLPTSPPFIPETKRGKQAAYNDPTAQALRQLTGQHDPPSLASRSRPTTKASAKDYDTVASGETASSMPTDASHVMAVTEEEMLLLEMMRNKRAAMAKNSFTEGYQLALKREQEHLVRRRESAQQTALKILKQRQEKEDSRSRRVSRTTEASTPQDERYDEQRRKYSAIRKEDVDKALKMEKYLTTIKTPTMEQFPEPPTRSNSLAEFDERAPQRFELLLPDVYSPLPGKVHELSSPVSTRGSSPPPEAEDIEDHHDQVRQFLASSSASENGAAAFPTPPSMRSKADSRREKRRSIMSPSPVAEEAPNFDMDEFPSPLSAPKQHRRSITGRRLSAHIDLDPLPERSSTLPAPLRQGPGHYVPQQYHLSPNFDFAPLDFNSSQLTASPSVSTSRASPLTPTFMAPPSSDKPTIEGAYSSDNASLRGRGAYTPDTDLTSLSASASASAAILPAASHKKRSAATKKVPPRLDTLKSNDRHARGSITSITSAGEDVLAAWASLGGGSEALASRRRVR